MPWIKEWFLIEEQNIKEVFWQKEKISWKEDENFTILQICVLANQACVIQFCVLNQDPQKNLSKFTASNDALLFKEKKEFLIKLSQ